MPHTPDVSPWKSAPRGARALLVTLATAVAAWFGFLGWLAWRG